MVNMYAGCRRSVFISTPYRHNKIISQCRSINRELLDRGLEKKKIKIEVASAGDIACLDSDYNWICSYRGYYIRARAVDHCVQDFLLKTQSLPRTQVHFLRLLVSVTKCVSSRSGIWAVAHECICWDPFPAGHRNLTGRTVAVHVSLWQMYLGGGNIHRKFFCLL